jgi:UDP-N-acetylmuramoyl-L-alanyl-D-glutamate--2,6-diaminopimelate ligase
MHVATEVITAALEQADLLVERRGTLPSEITCITDDSRSAVPGALFVAVRGSTMDGHDYLNAAAQAGATCAIVEDADRTALPTLVVRDARRAAAIAASAAYGWPAQNMQIVGVTGTNGKTTTVAIVRHLLDGPRDGTRSASIGTLGVLVGSAGEPLAGGGGLTTPGPVELRRVLRALADAGVQRVAMEVSSHSLDQRRVEGVLFDVAVYTNLTRDHLDYHKTMERYFAAKARLLDQLQPHGTVVYNLDDTAWRALKTDRRRVGYSRRVNSAEVSATEVQFGARGSRFVLNTYADHVRVELPLIGEFNVMNALAAAATAYALGMPAAQIAERLSTLPQISGRLELIHEHPTVLRDYAHTPDALERALVAVRPFAPERLILVFGCGGDRDRGKRPEMGRIAAAHADTVILTSDNPRTENPESILDEIEAGMSGAAHERIEDRRAAIARALAVASPGDVILLAGKGHETYQIRGTQKLPFDEREIVAELVAPGAAR